MKLNVFALTIPTGECGVRTYGGNGGGACCVFPFIYKGEVYNSCTTKDTDTKGRFNQDPWCAVTSNYDRDKKRGLCVQEHGKDIKRRSPRGRSWDDLEPF